MADNTFYTGINTKGNLASAISATGGPAHQEKQLPNAALSPYPDMTKIIVRREKSNMQDLLRDYAVLVDGKVVAHVSNGAETEFDVEPGKHTVQMKIDWCRSLALDVDVDSGKTVTLLCGPNVSILLGLLYITVWRNKYMWLRRYV
jgi:hypothetical protein